MSTQSGEFKTRRPAFVGPVRDRNLFRAHREAAGPSRGGTATGGAGLRETVAGVALTVWPAFPEPNRLSSSRVRQEPPSRTPPPQTLGSHGAIRVRE